VGVLLDSRLQLALNNPASNCASHSYRRPPALKLTHVAGNSPRAFWNTAHRFGCMGRCHYPGRPRQPNRCERFSDCLGGACSALVHCQGGHHFCNMKLDPISVASQTKASMLIAVLSPLLRTL
jgi:hypothetical protein